MSDYLVRATVKDRPIRIFACKTTDVCEKARQLHDLWPTSAAALGRMLTSVFMMAAMEKSQNKITATIQGGGPIGTMLAVSKGDGKIKGFVGEPHLMYTNNKTGKLDVGFAVGNQGFLQIIKDQGLKEPFVSQVPLQTGEIGDDFTMYYAYSEQTPSVVSVGVLVDTTNEVVASGGFVIQMLPGHQEEDIVLVEQALKDFPAVSSLIHEGKSPEDIIHMLFEDAQILGEPQPLSYECGCSKEHYEDALMTLGRKELQAMIDSEDACEVVCQFCSTRYHFSKEELQAIMDRIPN